MGRGTQAAASWTKRAKMAREAGLRSVLRSGCHWTPRTKWWCGEVGLWSSGTDSSGDWPPSTASMTPSSGQRAAMRRPSPGMPMAWWWEELTGRRRKPVTGSAGASAEVRSEPRREWGATAASVGDGDGFAGGVVDGDGGEVLEEGAAAPDVEGLEAEADGEDGLVEVVGVLEEEFVDVFAGGVGGGALGDGVVAVFLRVDVGGGAGEAGWPGRC